MAVRPLFVPSETGPALIRTIPLEFTFHPGFSIEQKRRSVRALHESAARAGFGRVLEISTKSEVAEGRQLSAFNLKVRLSRDQVVPVEAAFQASKVFSRGGPYTDLLSLSGAEIKRDPRLRNSGLLVRFELKGVIWPLLPRTAFYDWVYLQALHRQPPLRDFVMSYEAFTDIEFNPKRSLNCQAASVALYCSLTRRGLLEDALSSKERFLGVLEDFEEATAATRFDEPAPATFSVPDVREVAPTWGDRDLFYVVWPALAELMKTPKTEVELLEMTHLVPAQLKAWLRRAVTEGIARKLKKPVRFERVEGASHGEGGQAALF